MMQVPLAYTAIARIGGVGLLLGAMLNADTAVRMGASFDAGLCQSMADVAMIPVGVLRATQEDRP